LTVEEAKQVINMLTGGDIQVQAQATITTKEESRKLKRLSLNVTPLSVSFLDLLACKFPQLEELTLSVSKLVGSEQVQLLFSLLYLNSAEIPSSYSIHSVISSISDGTMTSRLPLLKTSCTPGNCTTSQFKGCVRLPGTQNARLRVPCLLWSGRILRNEW
jgi:hypothetical protein